MVGFMGEMLCVYVYVDKDNMRVCVCVCVGVCLCVCDSVNGYSCPYFMHTFVRVKKFSLKPPLDFQLLLSTSQSICYPILRKGMKCDWLLCLRYDWIREV